MKKFLIFCALIVCSLTAKSQIIAGEYFWDTDPGIGLGIPINPTEIAGGTLDETYEISAFAPSVSTGKHTLFVRFKQSDTLWSQAIGMDVLVGPDNFLSGSQNAADTAKVISSEYFWDNDSSHVFPAAISNYDQNFNFGSSFTAQNLSPGNHTVSYRTTDKFGYKSFWNTVDIVLLPNTPNLSKVEYWMDDEAVVPKTEASLTPNAATDVEANADIPTSGLSNGIHILNLRGKAEDQLLDEYISSDSSALYQMAVLVDPQYSLVAGQAFLSNNTSSQNYCQGGKIKIPVAITGNWPSQNIFTLQLSDSSGTAFTDISTTINPTNDTLVGDIPVNIPTGIHYRIRAVASYPYIASLSVTELKIGQTAAISTGNANPCEGGAIYLNAISSQVSTYSWTGPAGFSAGGAGVNRINLILAHSGIYTLTATATQTSCIATASISINVKPKPSLTASSNSPVCEGQSILLNSSSSNGGTFVAWNKIYPNSTLISNSNANPSIGNVALADSGKYQVAYALNGCSKMDTVGVIIKPKPIISGTSTNAPICSGQIIVVSTTATAGSTYAWVGPNSFSNGNSAWSISNATVAASGTYNLTVTLNGCTASSTVLNVVNPTPTVNPTTPVSVCEGSSLQLNVNNTPSATYGWVGPNGFSSIAEDPVVSASATANMAGTYTVTVSLASCSSSGNVIVQINTKPSLITVNQSAQAGGSVNLTLAAVTTGSTLPPGTTLGYFTNAGATVVLNNPNNVTLAGTYYIKATTTNGCIDIKPVVVTICGGTYDPITTPISSGTVTNVSTQKITATNIVSGSGTRATYRSTAYVELKPGFRADNGTIFKAEIGGCI